MRLVAPDIMEQAQGLSATVGVTGTLLGLLLWSLGWWGHRFWTVLLTTVTAGLVGLQFGALRGIQPLVAGLLLAVAAGALALLLARLLAYFAAGVALLLAVDALFPKFNEPVVCVLAGGLFGLWLFRFWVIALTSFAGALVAVHSGLGLLERVAKLDSVAWAENHGTALNWACFGLAGVGLVLQYSLELWHRSRKLTAEVPPEEKPEEKKSESPPATWWQWSWDVARRVHRLFQYP